MKITAFGVRPDERQHLERWARQHGDDLVQTSALLTPDTVAKAAGSAGISCFQTVPYEAAVFKTMRKLGINALALRNTGSIMSTLAPRSTIAFT